MNLTGKLAEEFTLALLDAFPTQPKLAQMLKFKLNINLESIAMGDNLNDIVFRVLRSAEAGGWIMELVRAAYETNPGNTKLDEFFSNLGVGTTITAVDIEKIIKPNNPFFDAGKWRNSLHSIEKQVCRIEVSLPNGITEFGTGFLVGRRSILTNFHVIKSLYGSIGTHCNPNSANIIARFDYKATDDSTVIDHGVTYSMDSKWLLDFSYERGSKDAGSSATLDYALLELEDRFDKVEDRGCLRIDTGTSVLKEDALIIMQHPQGLPLKLAIEGRSVIDFVEDNRSILHSVNTLPGSSGSPCFNVALDLVALHCGACTHTPQNIATLITPIYDSLKNNGIVVS